EILARIDVRHRVRDEVVDRAIEALGEQGGPRSVACMIVVDAVELRPAEPKQALSRGRRRQLTEASIEIIEAEADHPAAAGVERGFVRRGVDPKARGGEVPYLPRKQPPVGANAERDGEREREHAKQR